jgi:hypothetical protein
MKSTPEMKFWRQIASRLRNHSEEPDDMFENIVTALPSKDANWMDTTGHSFTALALLLFCLLINPFDRSGSYKTSMADLAVSANSSVKADRSGRESDVNEKKVPKPASNPERIKSARQIIGVLEKNNRSQSSIDIGNVASPAGDASEQLSDTFATSAGNSNHNDQAIPLILDQAPSLQPVEGKGSTSDSLDIAESTRTVSTSIAAPEENKKRKTLFRPTVFLSVTPIMTYQKLVPNKDDDFVMTGLNNPGLFASDRMGIQLDAGVERQLSRRFDLRVGLSYASFGQTISYRYLGGPVKEVTSESKLDYILEPGESSRTFRYSLKTIGATAGLSYLLKPGQLSHRAGAGLSYYHNKAYFRNEGRAQKKNSQSSVTYTLFYRFQYSISDRMEWFLQPSYTHSLSTFRPADEPFEMKPYRVGVGIGIVYRF